LAARLSFVFGFASASWVESLAPAFYGSQTFQVSQNDTGITQAHAGRARHTQMKLRILLLALFAAAWIATVILAFRDLGIQRVKPSTILLCVYVAGGLVSLIGGIILAHRRKIDSPILITVFTLHEFFLVLFIAFWPILGPLAIAELLYR